MKIIYFNEYDEAIAFASSAAFYVAVALAIMAIAVAVIAIGIYGRRANKVGFGGLLRKIAIFLMDGSLLAAILPFVYAIEATITFRSLAENIYIILTKVFTM